MKNSLSNIKNLLSFIIGLDIYVREIKMKPLIYFTLIISILSCEMLTGPTPANTLKLGPSIVLHTYVSKLGSDDNDGSKKSPYLTIQYAINNTSEGENIGVAEGTYIESIDLNKNVSLYGGYTANFENRGRVTVLNPTVASETLDIHGTVSSNTVIDGFTINGGSSGVNYAVFNQGSPIIQYNTINGGTSTGESYGIFNDTTSPVIQNNTINGGNATTNSYGIYNNSGSPVISYNQVNGGQGNDTYGIYNFSNSPVVQNNTINGGIAAGNYSNGIYNNSGSPEISNNQIDGGQGAVMVRGIYNNADSPEISYNQIYGGQGPAAYAILNEGGAAYIHHNTSVTAGNATNFGYAIYINGCSPGTVIEDNPSINGSNTNPNNNKGIFSSACTNLTIRRNAINVGSGGTAAYGIQSVNSDGMVIENNIINAVGGGSTPESYGVYQDNSDAAINGNDIKGGDAVNTSHGLYNNSSNLNIDGNEIYSGDAPIIWGIYFASGSGEIKNNAIQAELTTNQSFGVDFDNSPSVSIYNNTIYGGTGTGGTSTLIFGIRLQNNSSNVKIQNNTINAGKRDNAAAITGISMLVGCSNTIIENNIIFSQEPASTNMYGIYEDVDLPTSVNNNNMYFVSPTILYQDGTGVGLIEICSGIFRGGSCSNISIGSNNVNGAPDFVNINTDWHLKVTSPIKTAGVDLSGSFSIDKDGNARTPGWSIGAYENND